jgi:hypothetical protein
MLEQLAFALVAVALAAPFLVPLLWSQLGQSSQDTAAVAQDEQPIRPVVRRIPTVSALLIATSALVETADAQQSWRPLPNDPEQFRMIGGVLGADVYSVRRQGDGSHVRSLPGPSACCAAVVQRVNPSRSRSR